MNTEILLTKKPSEANVKDFKTFVCSVITEAYQYCGQRLKGDTEDEKVNELTFQANYLISDLSTKKFDKFLISDIRVAFKKGVSGEYGEYHGLNNRTYLMFMNARLAEKTSGLSFTPKALIETTPTPQEIDKINREAVITCYNLWLKTGEIYDRGNASYYYLWNRKILKFDEETWNKYVALAKQVELTRANEELKKAKQRFDKITVIAAHTELDRIENGSEMINVTARKIALADYFKSL